MMIRTKEIALVACVAATACSFQPFAAAGDDGEEPENVRPLAAPLFGAPLAGLSAAELALFDAGKAEFASTETVADGLGPVFNGDSCGGCHVSPAIGGSSDLLETRFGTITAGVFDPLEQLGGSLIQAKGIGGPCNIQGEVVPAQATILARRLTTPLFGLGFVDAVPDATLVGLAANQAQATPATAGRVARVTDVITGQPAVGRFGWKAQISSLFGFAASAYRDEMGITSPFVPTETCPQGNCSLLLTCDPVPDPEDDGSGVRAFRDFMTLLAAPPQLAKTAGAKAGEVKFEAVGCASCHTPRLKTGPSPIAALDRKDFFPYSDFLLHDMGSLGDGIAQNDAAPREMRTAPLWGARVRSKFLHDGRASTVLQAIVAHDGQGALARSAFLALPAAQQTQLLAFIDTL